MNSTLRWASAMALALFASTASATFHLYTIREVFSNADGTVQYVVLFTSFDGQNLWAGHPLTSTHAGVIKGFSFTTNLPSSATANRSVLIGTQGFKALGLIAPDYVIPDGFLATDGGTVNFAGVDFVTYVSLPTDGVSAINHAGSAVTNAPANFAGAATSLTALPVTSVEFYRSASDHYFISALQPDIDALDIGRFPGWVRTGLSFKVYPTQASGGAGVSPVCRFYIPPQHGDSHFFSADPVECNAVLGKIQTDPNYSGFSYETPSAFFIALPDRITGACPAGTIAVYRVWNQRADSNHRYTSDPAVRDAMVAKGYVAEGYGPSNTTMCAPA